MNLNKVIIDSSEACKIANLGMKLKNNDIKYSKLYYSSNECLSTLFKYAEVAGKDVLTVLGSGDHFFYSLAYGANSVITFDKNPLTQYYTLLRQWWMRWHHSFYIYPSILNNVQNFKDFLSNVFVKEEDILPMIFWNLYTNYVSSEKCFNLFYEGIEDNALPYDLLDFLSKQTLLFFEQDLLKSFDIKSHFDVIFLSNILEWNNEYNDLIVIRDNLNTILKEDGKIICSVHCRRNRPAQEMEAFDELFNYSEINRKDLNRICGYQYTRK